MAKAVCGLNCGQCFLKESCGGCEATKGRPFGGECMLAACCGSKGYGSCDECRNQTEGVCGLKKQLIAEFNALGIEDMEEVKDLNALNGAYINLEYTLPGGQAAKLWDESRIYLGNQLCKKGSDRCYGLTADENYLVVCEYGNEGEDAEIVVFRRRG